MITRRKCYTHIHINLLLLLTGRLQLLELLNLSLLNPVIKLYNNSLITNNPPISGVYWINGIQVAMLLLVIFFLHYSLLTGVL